MGLDPATSVITKKVGVSSLGESSMWGSEKYNLFMRPDEFLSRVSARLDSEFVLVGEHVHVLEIISYLQRTDAYTFGSVYSYGVQPAFSVSTGSSDIEGVGTVRYNTLWGGMARPTAAPPDHVPLEGFKYHWHIVEYGVAIDSNGAIIADPPQQPINTFRIQVAVYLGTYRDQVDVSCVASYGVTHHQAYKMPPWKINHMFSTLLRMYLRFRLAPDASMEERKIQKALMNLHRQGHKPLSEQLDTLGVTFGVHWDAFRGAALCSGMVSNTVPERGILSHCRGYLSKSLIPSTPAKDVLVFISRAVRRAYSVHTRPDITAPTLGLTNGVGALPTNWAAGVHHIALICTLPQFRVPVRGTNVEIDYDARHRFVSADLGRFVFAEAKVPSELKLELSIKTGLGDKEGNFSMFIVHFVLQVVLELILMGILPTLDNTKSLDAMGILEHGIRQLCDKALFWDREVLDLLFNGVDGEDPYQSGILRVMTDISHSYAHKVCPGWTSNLLDSLL
jgi:hypothetical protein